MIINIAIPTSTVYYDYFRGYKLNSNGKCHSPTVFKANEVNTLVCTCSS